MFTLWDLCMLASHIDLSYSSVVMLFPEVSFYPRLNDLFWYWFHVRFVFYAGIFGRWKICPCNERDASRITCFGVRKNNISIWRFGTRHGFNGQCSCPGLFFRNMFVLIWLIRHSVLMRCSCLQARQTEASLLLLRRGARQRGAGAADTNDNVSDNLSDKICAQLFLDVQVFL